MQCRLLFLILGVFLCCTNGYATFNDAPACFKQLQTDFFRPNFVVRALSLHIVPQSQWDIITRALQERSKRIPEILRQRSGHMRHSPINYPFQPNEALTMLLQLLFETFQQVMRENYVTNPSDIEGMFKYILSRQADHIRACLGPDIHLPIDQDLLQDQEF